MPPEWWSSGAAFALALVSFIFLCTNGIFDGIVVQSLGVGKIGRNLTERVSPTSLLNRQRALGEASMITSLEGMILGRHGEGAAAQVHHKNKDLKARAGNSSSRAFDVSNVGFYVQVYNESPEYLGEMLTGIRRYFPSSPIVVLSDHGNRYDEFCAFYNCTFVWAKEQLNVDRGRKPHTYNCKDQMRRIANAIELNKVQYIFLWESDARVVGPLLNAPTHDLMQMGCDHNHFRPKVKALVDELFPYLEGTVKGWTSTGGTLFDGLKVAKALASLTLDGFYSSDLWTNLVKGFSLADTTEDCCLIATAMVAGMTVGMWKEYGELPRLSRDFKESCVDCIYNCKQEHPSSAAARWTLSHEQPDVDRCISTDCGNGHRCPAVLHGVKQTWGECDLTGGEMYGWCKGIRRLM